MLAEAMLIYRVLEEVKAKKWEAIGRHLPVERANIRSDPGLEFNAVAGKPIEHG